MKKCFLSGYLLTGLVLHVFAQAPTTDEFLALQQAYQERVATTEAKYLDLTKKIPSEYTNALNRLEQLLARNANLDGVLAVRGERDRFAVSQDIPANAVVQSPAELKALQEKFSGMPGTLESAKRKEIARFSSDYVEKLERIKATLTKSLKIDEAVAIKHEIEKVRTGTDLTSAGKPVVTQQPIPARVPKDEAPPKAVLESRDSLTPKNAKMLGKQTDMPAVPEKTSPNMTTRYVSPSGSNSRPYTSWKTAARTIQQAIDECANGDEVVVAPSTYSITETIQLNKQITVRSSSGASSTILDGGYPTRKIQAVNISTQPAFLDGFTITQFDSGVWCGYGEGTGGQVRSCVIAHNKGTGIHFNHGGSAKNCTVAFNGGAGVSVYDMGGGGDEPANMLVWSNAGGDFVRNSGNIGLHSSWTNNPLFVSEKDFHLLPNSPCIDSGKNEAWMSTAIDADARPRIINDTVDIGAYEAGVGGRGKLR